MSNLVKYGSYELEEADREESDNQNTGAEFIKLEVGRNIVRILPPPLGKKSPFRVVWTHYFTPPGSQTSVSFACPAREAQKPCPMCDTADRLKSSGNPADHERAKAFFARRRVYANAINRNSPEAGVQILGFGKGIHDDLIALRKNPDWGGDFTHPETGFDIVIERKGTTKNDTEYKVYPKKQSPLGNLEWLENQPDLDKLSKVLTPEQIKAKVSGQSEVSGSAGGQPASGSGTVVDATLDPTKTASGKVPF